MVKVLFFVLGGMRFIKGIGSVFRWGISVVGVGGIFIIFGLVFCGS